jgi:hypothetical protein
VNKLDPQVLFQRILRDVPEDLHGNLFITGSLAAAYHFRAALEGHAVNTKDADVVVHPAGDVEASRRMAERFLASGWRRADNCYPQSMSEPADSLRAIRLLPPDSTDYFLELLNLPDRDQVEPRRWIPVRLRDGWYGLASFKYMGVTALFTQRSDVGLSYAAPEMMALANLLAHPMVGPERMESGGPMHDLLRSAKDLGRVLALAWLAGRDQAAGWLPRWREGLRQCFSERWQALAVRAGDGLRDLLRNDSALEEAQRTTEVGLLNGKGVTVEMLQATAQRLFVDVINPLAQEAGAR